MAEDFDSLVRVLRANSDEFGWLQPLLDDPSSLAVLGAAISVFARMGAAAVHNRDTALISAASGGRPGGASLTLVRTDGSTSGTVPAGYPFVDSRGARAFALADTAVAAGQLSVVVQLQTLRQTELVNTEDDPGFSVAPDGAVVPGSSGVLLAPAGSPGVTATTLVPAGATPITGGAADYLSVHGSERGQLRQPSEGEADYRQRIRNVPDVVSPIAVADVLQAIAQRLGLPPFLLLEPFNDGATPALKALHGLSNFTPTALDTDFFDDPATELVDRRSVTAYMAIQAQEYVRDVASASVYWDDGFWDDAGRGYPDPTSIFPPAVLASLLALFQGVAERKGGGVAIDLFLKNYALVTGMGASASASFATVWTLAPPAGKIWMLGDSEVGHDSPNPSAAIAHRVTFTFEGGSTLTTAPFGQAWTEKIPAPGRRVTQVVGQVVSDGAIPAHLVGVLRVLEMTT